MLGVSLPVVGVVISVFLRKFVIYYFVSSDVHADEGIPCLRESVNYSIIFIQCQNVSLRFPRIVRARCTFPNCC